MQKSILLIFITIITLIMLQKNSTIMAQPDFEPPPTQRYPVIDTIHGYVITDYFRWLEDKNDAKVKEWSKLQYEYTVEYIKKNYKEIPGLRNEIRDFLNRDYKGAPFFKGNRQFFYVKKKGEKQNKIYTIIDSKEIKIFDPEVIDTSGLTSITDFQLTKDGYKAAVGVQFKGDEISEYRIIDTKTGKFLGVSIKNLSGFSWTKDEEHAYITVRTREMIDKQIPLKTYLHKIGDDTKNDVFIISPPDAKDFASIWDTEEGGLTFISEGDFWSNSLKVRKAGTMEEPKLIYPKTTFTAAPMVRGNKIYIYTNHDAPNYKLMITDIDKPESKYWAVFYPEKKTMLVSYVVTNNYVIILEKHDVLKKLIAYDHYGKFVKEIELPEITDIGGISWHRETNTVFVSLNTFENPSKLYKLDGKTLKWEFFWQDNPSLDTKNIESKLVFYNSKDGTKIPMFIINKKGTKLDGNNHTILYGYGGFNIGMSPGYIGTTASFVNRGGVYAIACLRGGNEYGENWHKAGMLNNKQNVFDDFISAAEYLIKEKYTNPKKLAIKGGSNGGLLTGAVMIQRPDLFKLVYCSVPLLDMVRYHKFLIARYWIPEYGDPVKEDDFLNIIKYSPYQNIKIGYNYPTIMLKAGENDTRVDPLHAKKFAAALRYNPGQMNPILLFIDFDSGHGSGKSIQKIIDETELDWRYIMRILEIKE